MQVMEAIQARRSIRQYKPDAIEQEKLDQLAEAFRLSPSARNSQSWKLLIVRDPEKRDALVQALGSRPPLVGAPVILCACGLNSSDMPCGHRADSVDLSIALSFVMLEACDLGLGTCWMGSHEEDKVRSVLGLPDSVTIPAITPLGYAAEAPDARPRKALTDVVEYI
ncbi:nitroreductase family protein [Ruminococcaceae bacterium OttesenSCG-928-L11]|nr:nitroreductase family protein [Ruminococcaceae bacterium OttesenSCG-928-L11]